MVKGPNSTYYLYSYLLEVLFIDEDHNLFLFEWVFENSTRVVFSRQVLSQG